jgi:hypothetical protein
MEIDSQQIGPRHKYGYGAGVTLTELFRARAYPKPISTEFHASSRTESPPREVRPRRAYDEDCAGAEGLDLKRWLRRWT